MGSKKSNFLYTGSMQPGHKALSTCKADSRSRSQLKKAKWVQAPEELHLGWLKTKMLEELKRSLGRHLLYFLSFSQLLKHQAHYSFQRTKLNITSHMVTGSGVSLRYIPIPRQHSKVCWRCGQQDSSSWGKGELLHTKLLTQVSSGKKSILRRPMWESRRE